MKPVTSLAVHISATQKDTSGSSVKMIIRYNYGYNGGKKFGPKLLE